MRVVFVAALLAAVPVLAQDPFLTGDALKSEVESSCKDGCMVLNHEQFRGLVQNVNELVQEREAAAFKRGSLSCRNAI